MKRKFTLKSEAQRLAQVEQFADKGVKEFSNEQKLLLQYSRDLSTVTDLNDLPEHLPDELKELVLKHKDNYRKLVQSADAEKLELKRINAELYKKVFAEPIKKLQQKISSTKHPKTLPEYLGSGSNGTAYVIEVEGKKYAAKFTQSPVQSNFEIKPLLQARGINRVAQIISYSFADSVVIMELLPGIEVTKMPPEETQPYSDQQIEQLIQTVINLDEQGIVIDPKASNFFYDKEHGFSILDFHLKHPNGGYPLYQSILDLRNALSARNWPYTNYDTPEYEQQQIEYNKVYLPTMIQLLSILETQHPELLKQYNDDLKENPRGRPALINRDYISTVDPTIQKHLKKLEEMGY